MAGVGKQMQAVQEELAEKILEVSSGGGAVNIQITGQGEFKGLKIDPEFLKEDAEFVEEALLAAVQEAAEKAKAESEEAMGAVTGGMGGFPGL